MGHYTKARKLLDRFDQGKNIKRKLIQLTEQGTNTAGYDKLYQKFQKLYEKWWMKTQKDDKKAPVPVFQVCRMNGCLLWQSNLSSSQAREAANQNPKPEFQFAVNYLFGSKIREYDSEEMTKIPKEVRDLSMDGFGCDERVNDNTGDVEHHIAIAVAHSNKVPHRHNYVKGFCYPHNLHTW